MGRSLRRSPQKAWIVPMRASSSSSSARSSRVALFGRRVRSRLLDLEAQPQLHLAGRFLGEGDRDGPRERATPASDQPDDAADERGRLAGPGRRFDEEGRAELGKDPRSRVRVGEVGHGDARTALSGFEVLLRLACRAVLLIRTADDPIVAALTLPFPRRGRQERTCDRVADRLGDLNGRITRSLIERDDLL